ncbi:MAG: hypothetical protein C5B59_14040 [Bacteroidetes bacterium]|nr:MAG: hypothetical protein C5B59_14040 [Bacteroidota bacterium]
MPSHEEKICPRCEKSFECKSGDIAHCQCTQIHLSVEERAFIEEHYEDCLCTQCLLDLKSNYLLYREKILSHG